MSKKQQERKKKNREKIARARVLARRKHIRDTMKKEKQDQIRFETEYELKNGKQKPFVKDIDPEQEKIKNENIKNKLERNMKLLEALEQEYIREQKEREENMKLTEGMDLKEKIKTIAEKNLEKNQDESVE
jgi:hypothetical protein